MDIIEYMTQADEIIKKYNHDKMVKAALASLDKPYRTKEYYSNLGKRSAEKRRLKREKAKNSLGHIGFSLLSSGKI